jgi:hypothetical protein
MTDLFTPPHTPNSHPIAMEPARAAARERWIRAPKGERTARLQELRSLTIEALIWNREARNG